MANQDQAFAAAMRIVAQDHPEYFSLKDGYYYFFDWRMTLWLCLAMDDALDTITEVHRDVAPALGDAA